MNKFLLINVLVFILISCIYYNVGYHDGQIDGIKKMHDMVTSGDSLKCLVERK